MAGIRRKGDAFYCTFRFNGRRHYFTVGEVSEDQAKAKGVEVDEILDLIKRGRVSVPDGVLLEDFVAHGGKVLVVSAKPETISLRNLIDLYLATHANGVLEDTTLATAKIHLNHIAKSFGERFRVQTLSRQNLQEHIDRRRGRASRHRRSKRKSLRSAHAGTGQPKAVSLLAYPQAADFGFPKNKRKNRSAHSPKSKRRSMLKTRMMIDATFSGSRSISLVKS